LLAFALTNIGLGAFASVREPPGRELRTPTPFRERVRDLPALLHAEPDFRRYLSARLLASAARGVLPLYIVWIGREFGMTGARLGTFTVMFTVAQSGSTLGWGWLGDRGGYKRVFQLSTLCWLAGTALLLMSASVWLASLTYGLVGAGVGGFILAGSNLCSNSERARARDAHRHAQLLDRSSVWSDSSARIARGRCLLSFRLPRLDRAASARDPPHVGDERPASPSSRPGRTDVSPAEDLD
jgi:hypothetical protein